MQQGLPPAGRRRDSAGRLLDKGLRDDDPDAVAIVRVSARVARRAAVEVPPYAVEAVSDPVRGEAGRAPERPLQQAPEDGLDPEAARSLCQVLLGLAVRLRDHTNVDIQEYDWEDEDQQHDIAPDADHYLVYGFVVFHGEGQVAVVVHLADLLAGPLQLRHGEVAEHVEAEHLQRGRPEVCHEVNPLVVRGHLLALHRVADVGHGRAQHQDHQIAEVGNGGGAHQRSPGRDQSAATGLQVGSRQRHLGPLPQNDEGQVMGLPVEEGRLMGNFKVRVEAELPHPNGDKELRAHRVQSEGLQQLLEQTGGPALAPAALQADRAALGANDRHAAETVQRQQHHLNGVGLPAMVHARPVTEGSNVSNQVEDKNKVP
mmetsp:Transcript_106231/g.342728  ORF Transcript_106231/g.342728 Transcript_106231/m.342728 type:complete len:372 (+) Transcript_106231:104-1219(+)